MKKWLLIMAALTGLLVSCHHPADSSSDIIPDNENNETIIIFDNTHGICDVTVYGDYRRREDDKILTIPAGQLSAEFKWMPATSIPFYFTYHIKLKEVNNYTVNYIPEIGRDQIAVRIDTNTTTNIIIPKIEETVSSPDQLLSSNSFILIQNNSSYSFNLLRGISPVNPENSPGSAVVNSGERAQYSISHGTVTNYRLLIGAEYQSFPESLTSFETGHVYYFVFDSELFLIFETELKLENITKISQDDPVPMIPDVPIVIASDGLLTVRWAAVTEAESYAVYISRSQDPPALPVKTVSSTTTVLDGLVNKTIYYIWVKAINSSGSGDFSPAARGIPWPSNEIPAVPNRPSIIPGIHQLTVNWEQCGGAVSYEVYINTSTTRPASPETTTNKASTVIKNLENDIIYYVWVRAVNSTGKSDYSHLEAGTPKIPTAVPLVPDRPVVTVGSRQLTVSWQAVELAAVYEVWVGTTDNSSAAKKQDDDITGTETVITGLVNEITYYVWIQAKNVVGTSGFSPAASGTPQVYAIAPHTPDAPIASIGNGQISITWTAIQTAKFYEIWLATENNSGSASKHGEYNNVSFSVTINGLNNGTSYYYSIFELTGLIKMRISEWMFHPSYISTEKQQVLH